MCLYVNMIKRNVVPSGSGPEPVRHDLVGTIHLLPACPEPDRVRGVLQTSRTAKAKRIVRRGGRSLRPWVRNSNPIPGNGTWIGGLLPGFSEFQLMARNRPMPIAAPTTCAMRPRSCGVETEFLSGRCTGRDSHESVRTRTKLGVNQELNVNKRC